MEMGRVIVSSDYYHTFDLPYLGLSMMGQFSGRNLNLVGQDKAMFESPEFFIGAKHISNITHTWCDLSLNPNVGVVRFPIDSV